jgi:hypothetical protein
MSKARDLANAGTALTTVSATELGYLDGVTSAVQTQIDSKIGSASAINPTIVDAKGDIVAATAADTVARLAVGANDTVLTADSTAATGLKWATPAAGGMTLLSTTTLSGASTTISSISGSYTNLQIFIYGMTNNTGQGQFKLTFNALGNSNNYTIVQFTNNGTLATQINQNDAIYFTYSSDNISRNYANNVFSLTVNNYASTASMKSYNINGYYQGNNWNQGVNGGGGFNNTAAISQIVLSNTGGTFSAGTCLVYGVK